MNDRAMLRRGTALIWRQLRTAPRPFSVGTGGAALWAAATVASSMVLGWITDDVLLPAVDAGEVGAATLAGAAGAVLGIAVFKAVGVVGRRLGAYVAQYRLQEIDRTAVTRRYLALPLTWHRRHSTGQLLSNASSDVESAAFVAAPLPMAIGATLMLAITAVLLIVTDPFLALIGFGVGPGMAGVNFWFQRRMRVAAAEAQRSRAQVTEVAHESFDGALVVKTLGREQAEVHRFRRASDQLRDQMVRLGRLRGGFDPLMEALPNFGILLVLFVGAWRVEAGVLSAGDLVQFAYLFRLVALPMRVFGWLLGELPRAVIGFDRVARVLTTTGDMVYGGARPARYGGARLDADAVSYLHPDTVAEDLADVPAEASNGAETRGVTDVTFAIPSGETIAMVGPTGSGKSTVAALLVRLYDPDTGTVHLDGESLPALDREVLARDAVVVFQEAFLFDGTVRDNITLGEPFSDDDVCWAARLAQADSFIAELDEGYDTPVGERGATLSGGQRQRIALARALIRRPRLLVLDDATSAVDPAVEQDILRGLATAGLESTVVIVAYRKGSIALADEVVFVDHGRVVARGRHDDLLATLPAYADLVRAYEQSDGAEGVA